MKNIVTHTAPDMDAITSVWILKRFLPGWENAEIKYVYAGKKYKDKKTTPDDDFANAIEKYGEDEIIHVDTGMGPLDHHQTSDDKICGATRSLDYTKLNNEKELKEEKLEAVKRMVSVVVEEDHFKEALRPDPLAFYNDFSIGNVLDGLKIQKPGDDEFYREYIFQALDALLHAFEDRIWSEKEIENGIEFESKHGKSLGMETLSSNAVKLAQLMDYVIVVRKNPTKGHVSIKARPDSDVDFTNTYEQLKKMDPDATWFLHVSKKMLLNGSSKNPGMNPSILSLDKLISVLRK